MTFTITQKDVFNSSPDLQRTDIHQHITDTIIKQIEKGIVPWLKPWNDEGNFFCQLPKNFVTDRKYHSINTVLLWSAAQEHQYRSNEWASYKQWKAKNEAVKKGEKGTMVVFYDIQEKEEDGEIKKFQYATRSYVFNRCQLVSYNSNEQMPIVNQKSLVERIDLVDNFVTNTKAAIEYNHSKACYNKATDKISLPDPISLIDTENCTASEGYYSTLLNELIHWTGHSTRLDRNFSEVFGRDAYAVEALVAELGSAFMCSEFDISRLEKENHANIANWLDVLKANKDAVAAAASEAFKACDYLRKLQPA